MTQLAEQIATILLAMSTLMGLALNIILWLVGAHYVWLWAVKRAPRVVQQVRRAHKQLDKRAKLVAMSFKNKPKEQGEQLQ